MVWHMCAPPSVGPAFHPSAAGESWRAGISPQSSSILAPALMAMARLQPCLSILWFSTKTQWDPSFGSIFVAAGAALVQDGEGLGHQLRGKWKIRFACTSRLLLQQHPWRTLLTGCVCRGKTPHLSLAQAAGKSSCVVPPKCLSGQVEGRAGGVCGLQVCLNSKFFTEPGKLADFLSAGDSGKPSLCSICGISRLVSVVD